MRWKQIVQAGIVAVGLALQVCVAFAQNQQPLIPQLNAGPLPTGRPGPTPAFSTALTGLDVTAPNPFLGSVPSGIATMEEMPLSLTDAIQRGLRSNLGRLLSEQDTRAALGEQRQARSSLLPNVTARTAETAQQINLAEFGFSGFAGTPHSIIGPFGVFDTRVYLSQSIFDQKAISNARAGSENLKAAKYSFDNARDVVVLVVANLYLQAVAGVARIEAAQAQLNTAQALYDQAVSFKQAGVVPAIEVLRAQVELQARQQQLIFFQNEFEKQKLSLTRAIGLPLQQPLRLTDRIPYAPLAPMSLEEALKRAYGSRSDYQSAAASLRATEFARKAAEAERFPSLSLDTDYGDLGKRPGSSHGTFTAAASLRVPLYQGGRIQGEILQSDALLRQQRAVLEDLRSRIEYEIRTVFLDLKASGDRVEVARSALQLAQQQVEQAQDRFAAGVTGNIEVVQAQEALSTANENYIASTFDYNIAKTALARALGGAEKTYQQFLLGETQ